MISSRNAKKSGETASSANRANRGDPGCPQTPGSDSASLVSIARRIHTAGLGPATLLWLESIRPLTFLGAQALRVLEPFLGLFLEESRLADRISQLEDRREVSRFLDLLEKMERS